MIEVPVTEHILASAEYFAHHRLLYEFPRCGYGSYDESHLPNLINGYLGEFAFMEYIHSVLDALTQRIPPAQRHILLRDVFEYRLVIGSPYSAYDFRLLGRSVEVKTYGTRYVRSYRECLSYRLLVDCEQGTNADIYVQCFVVGDSCPRSVILAGVHFGLPNRIDRALPKPAHYCPVKELRDMSVLERMLERHFA